MSYINNENSFKHITSTFSNYLNVIRYFEVNIILPALCFQWSKTTDILFFGKHSFSQCSQTQQWVVSEAWPATKFISTIKYVEEFKHQIQVLHFNNDAHTKVRVIHVYDVKFFQKIKIELLLEKQLNTTLFLMCIIQKKRGGVSRKFAKLNLKEKCISRICHLPVLCWMVCLYTYRRWLIPQLALETQRLGSGIWSAYSWYHYLK